MKTRVNSLLIGIGDLHGHYPALEQLLGALQESHRIFDGRTPDRLRRGVKLVFTGDFIDRGDQALAIIARLQRLSFTILVSVVSTSFATSGAPSINGNSAFSISRVFIPTSSPIPMESSHCNTRWHGEDRPRFPTSQSRPWKRCLATRTLSEPLL